MSAVAVAKVVFRQRGIGIDQLPPAKYKLLPLNAAAEAKRAIQVRDFGQVSPGLVQNTTDLLLRELWLRPALVPRDRGLVTVSALIASGQVAQIPYHLNRRAYRSPQEFRQALKITAINPTENLIGEANSNNSKMERMFAALLSFRQRNEYAAYRIIDIDVQE
jgi:alkylhydroperoxidase/carboxymuconolactone decarboxylase family protein YurZ